MTTIETRRRFLRLMFTIILTIAAALAAAWTLVAQPTVGRNQPSAATVEPERLKKHVLTLSEDYYPRHHRSTDNLDACAKYIRVHFERAGARTQVQDYTVAGNTYRNVSAFFGPANGRRIVIGAHYDAAGHTPGADDNASGVAGLVELAYLLGRTNVPVQIELVAFTLEEPPYFGTRDMGSARHADALSANGVDVSMMICLEMIGRFSDEPGSQRFPLALLKLFYPSRANFIGVVGHLGQRSPTRRVKRFMKGAAELPVYSISGPMSLPGIDLSDHRNYWHHGWDAVMITDTSFYRNSDYHTLKDTSGALDYTRMACVVVQVYEAVIGISRDESSRSRPANVTEEL